MINDDDSGKFIGSAQKTGFETSFVVPGHHSKVLVEAVDKKGEVLSHSAVIETELPLGWHDGQDSNDWEVRKQALPFFAGMALMFFVLRVRPRWFRALLHSF